MSSVLLSIVSCQILVADSCPELFSDCHSFVRLCQHVLSSPPSFVSLLSVVHHSKDYLCLLSCVSRFAVPQRLCLSFVSFSQHVLFPLPSSVSPHFVFQRSKRLPFTVVLCPVLLLTQRLCHSFLRLCQYVLFSLPSFVLLHLIVHH